MDDGTHQVSLTVHDGFDSSTADTADIIINNLAPRVEIGADLLADECSEVTQTASATEAIGSGGVGSTSPSSSTRSSADIAQPHSRFHQNIAIALPAGLVCNNA